MKNENNNNPLRAFALVGTIGVEMATAVIFGFWGGKQLDSIFHTSPWLMLTGVLLGLAAGIYGITLLIKQFFGD